MLLVRRLSLEQQCNARSKVGQQLPLVRVSGIYDHLVTTSSRSQLRSLGNYANLPSPSDDNRHQ